mgnify:CR=1 FL=1
MDYSEMRGFNYQPSYGSTGYELWRKFDAEVVERELGLGKQYFPGINAIRYWLSWDAYVRDPGRFAECFEHVLAIAHGFGLRVMPVLFNRWHDPVLDYGGVYLEQLLEWKTAAEAQQPESWRPYVERVVGEHAADERIFAWDLCNEPYNAASVWPTDGVETETRWLERVYAECKRQGARAPITVGAAPGLERVRRTVPVSDVISIHPYYLPEGKHTRADYERKLDEYVALARKSGKPLLATECCWGMPMDDLKRAEFIRYTLGELKKRGIGQLVYLLHWSGIADAHGPDGGPVGAPGNLSFINKDGSLRAGHEVFNEF